MMAMPRERSSNGWLYQLLVNSVEERMCVEIHCTTCGAIPFRRGLFDGLARASGQSPVARLDRQSAREIAEELALVRPTSDEAYRLEPAARYIIFAVWQTLGGLISEPDLEAMFAGSWAGGVLASMQAHHREREAARRRYEESQDPVRVQERRDERRRLRQEERLARRQERDRIRIEGQEQTST